MVCASVHRHPALGFEVAFLLLELFPIDLATRIALLEDIQGAGRSWRRRPPESGPRTSSQTTTATTTRINIHPTPI